MSTSVAASDVQKNFGLWHDKALQEPVQITKYGRETVYLISADTFHQLWQSYQRAASTAELTDEEMALMSAARTPAEHDYDYERPGTDDWPGHGPLRLDARLCTFLRSRFGLPD